MAIANCRVIRDKRGLVVGLEGTIVGITERKKAETAGFKAKEREQVTLQSIGGCSNYYRFGWASRLHEPGR